MKQCTTEPLATFLSDSTACPRTRLSPPDGGPARRVARERRVARGAALRHTRGGRGVGAGEDDGPGRSGPGPKCVSCIAHEETAACAVSVRDNDSAGRATGRAGPGRGGAPRCRSLGRGR